MNKLSLLITCVFLLSSCSTIQSEKENEQNSNVLGVPFSSQAPFANWDDPYQEACEEMSLLMVHNFFENKDMNPESANSELLSLLRWESKNQYPEDVTIQELAEISVTYFDYLAAIVVNPSIDDLKNSIDEGNPIIVPAAGRKLDNPYFSGEGPWYHMLVITGYTDTHFITNDPGTRRGEGYEYEFDTLLNSIHNWTGVKEEIENGDNLVLVLSKKV